MQNGNSSQPTEYEPGIDVDPPSLEKSEPSDGPAPVGSPGKRWRIAALAGIFVLLVGTIVALLVVRQPVTIEQQKPAKTDLTEQVEKRMLVSKVVTRGNVGSVGESAVSCYPATAGTEVKVFTRPAEKGKQLKEGELLAAVNGRPVLVLQGDVAAFRDMLPGSSGPDVEQLQAALTRLGHKISDTKGTLGASTQAAINSLYTAAGFVAKGPTPEESARLRAAQDALAQSEVSITSASTALKEAKKGPTQSAILSSKLAVSEAEQRVTTAATPAEKTLATKQLEIARAQYDELWKKTDLTSLNASYDAAVKSRDRAKAELAALTTTTGISVPYCEVVFLPALPATVAKVQADGKQPGGVSDQPAGQAQAPAGWATLAPGNLVLRSELNTADLALITQDAPVSFRSDSETTDHTGKVTAIDATGITITPDQPFDEAQRGQNLRVTVNLKATAGEVLVVPLAAVSGTADGLARVVKLTGDHRSDVPVRAGLTADGYVEVSPVTEGTLAVGDSVVVGR